MIRLLLVEDDPDWIKLLSGFIGKEEDMLIVGAVSTREQAVRLAKTIECDIVLMDINLTENNLDGIYAAADILEMRPNIKVIMLTSLTAEDVMLKAFTAGAVHYIAKSDYKELPSAIRLAASRTSSYDVLMKEFARLKQEEQLLGLTPAEREVYDLLEQGYTHSQIETKLHKAESTLKNQINKLLKKLGVRSGKDAVEKVRKKGL